MWPKFISPLPPANADIEIVIDTESSQPTATKDWTLAKLKRLKKSLMRQIERERSKAVEKLQLLESCRALAEELESLKIRTHSV